MISDGVHPGSIRRVVRFVLLLTVSWCVMTFVHEVGHIVGGWASGAILTDYMLWPWGLPYSFFSPDPHPLVTLWAGPILGVAIPLAIAAAMRHPTAWFIANFCLVANGAYLTFAWFAGDPWLDTPRLLSEGASPLMVALYCVLTISCGYFRFRSDCMRLLRGDAAVGGEMDNRP